MKTSLLLLILCAFGFPAAAENALLLDKCMLDPLAFKPFFEHFKDQKVDFKYRRYHPTLVKRDIEEFQIILVACGPYPKPSATRLYPEETALLKAFASKGGTLVILPGGSSDNYQFNKMLEDLKVKVRIEGKSIMEATGYKSTLVPSTYFLNLPNLHVSPDTPLGEGIKSGFPAGRIVSIMVGQEKDIEIPAYSSPLAMRMTGMDSSPERGMQAQYQGDPTRAFAAVVTAKAGEGYVIIASRLMFNLNGFTGKWSDKPIAPPYALEENLKFDKAFVKYVTAIERKEYTPKTLIPIARLETLGKLEPPKDILEEGETRGEKTRAIQLDEEAHPQDYEVLASFETVKPSVPGFLNGEKVKSGYTHVLPSPKDADRVCDIYKKAGLNLLYIMPGDRLYRSLKNETEMARLTREIEATVAACDRRNIKVLLGGFTPSRPQWQEHEMATRLVDGNGRSYQINSPFDELCIKETLLDAARVLSEYALKYPKTMMGYFWDFELYGHAEMIISESYSFDNHTFATYLEKRDAHLRPRNLHSEGMKVDQTGRFRWLESKGLLRDYYENLEDEAYIMARRAKKEIDRFAPGMFWGFYTAGIPESWYYKGIFRGFAGEDGKVLLATYEARGIQQISYWRTRGVDLMHLPGVLMNTPLDDEWGKFLKMSMGNESGYWLFPIGALTDGNWRLQNNDSPVSQNPEVVVDLIRKANEEFNPDSPD